jgi:hypothetical protein
MGEISFLHIPTNSLLKNEFYKGRFGARPVGEFSMGRVRQCPYKTSF